MRNLLLAFVLCSTAFAQDPPQQGFSFCNGMPGDWYFAPDHECEGTYNAWCVAGCRQERIAALEFVAYLACNAEQACDATYDQDLDDLMDQRRIDHDLLVAQWDYSKAACDSAYPPGSQSHADCHAAADFAFNADIDAMAEQYFADLRTLADDRATCKALAYGQAFYSKGEVESTYMECMDICCTENRLPFSVNLLVR